MIVAAQRTFIFARSQHFAHLINASVTMPIKASILPYLDEISHECQVTGACNTIVKVPTSSGFKLVGQNTDSAPYSCHISGNGVDIVPVLGVRNSLLSGLRSQFPDVTIHSESAYPSSVRGAGLIIGGGATTRSAAYALTLLGLSPIFLINRDVEEVRAVQKSLSHLNVIHLKSSDDVERLLAQPDSSNILMIVGAIREFALICFS